MLELTNLIVILSLCCVWAFAAPYQELAPKAGYVPVYIREGNTPLSEIHPKLVEAFHEDEQPNKLQLESVQPAEVSQPNNVTEEENVGHEGHEEINNSDDMNEEKFSDKSNLDESAKIEETTASDIAKFESDDPQIFTNDREEH